MKILLLGEYSNVHWTLAEGLRALGHEVTVVSDGDHWKGYRRDVDLSRKSLHFLDSLKYYWKVRRTLRKCKGYDIVQFINPIFLDLKAELHYKFFEQLKRENKKLVLGAFGIDHYWVKTGLDAKTFRYSDFNIGNTIRQNADNDAYIADWLTGEKGKLNQMMVKECDAIVTGLYEYDCCYKPLFPEKTTFIPFPIDLGSVTPVKTLQETEPPQKIRFFIGIQKSRSAYKGTDIMLAALTRLQKEYPDRMEVVKVESVPFQEYQTLMNESHVLLDQLYSYTPGMNALLAMAKGLVVVGGGEEEQYALLGETELRPIINVQPNEEDVYQQIKERILEHPEALHQLQLDSVEYVKRYHDHLAVARAYEGLFLRLGVRG